MNHHKHHLIEANKNNLYKSHTLNNPTNHKTTYQYQHQNQCTAKVQKYHKPECHQKVVNVCTETKIEKPKIVEKVRVVEKRVPEKQMVQQFVPKHYDLSLPKESDCVGIVYDDRQPILQEYKDKQSKHCQKIKALKLQNSRQLDLQKQNEYLQNQIEKIKMDQIDRNALSMDQNMNYDMEIKRLQEGIDQRNAQIKDLEQSLFKLQDQNDRLKWEIQNDVPEKIRRQIHKKRDYELKSNELELDINRLRNTNDEIQLEIGQNQNQIKVKDSQIQRKEQQIQDLEKKVEELKEWLDEYMKLKQLELLNRELEKKTIKMDGVITNQNTELTELRSQLNQFGGLPQVLDSTLKNRDEVMNKAQDLENQYQMRRQKDEHELEELKRINQQKSMEIERLREQLMRNSHKGQY